MKSFTKQESQLIVNHVCICIEKEGMSQEKLCGELEGSLDPSSFTRAKQGMKRLKNEHLSQLIGWYGYPRVGKGVFVEAEHYDELKEFINSYNDTQEARFTNRQIRIWQKSEFIESLMRSFIIIDKNLQNTSDKKTYVLTQLQSMLQDEGFQNWFDLYEAPKNISSLQNTLYGIEEISIKPTLSDVLEIYNIDCMPDFPIEVLLQRLGAMNYSLNLIEQFDIENQSPCTLPIDKELVISGKQILNESIVLNDFIDKKFQRYEALINQYSLADELTSFEPNNMKHRLIIREYISNNDHVERWEKVQFQIFLGTEMGYHFLITFKGKTSRTVVISLQNNSEIISAVSEVYQFLGLKNVATLEIKSLLAEAGAYIPGTTLLT